MTVPQKLQMKAYQGDTLGLQVKLWADTEKTVPVVVDGAEVAARVAYVMRSSQGVENFAVTTSGNVIDLILSPTQTQRLPSTCVFDVQVTWSPGVVQTIATGNITFLPGVTP